jgi:hypothetical protein
MNLSNQKLELIAQETTPNNHPQNGLIAKNLQQEQYIGIAILLISLVAVIGFISRQLEYALVFALCVSLIFIVIFLGI